MPNIFDAEKEKKEKNKVVEQPQRDVDEYSEVMKKEKPTKKLFEAFAPKPRKTTFDSQAKGERIILLLRKHPITQFNKTLIIIFGLLFPILVPPAAFMGFLAPKFFTAFFLGWYLLLAGYTIESFLSWFFNVYIITDERIIDVDFLSLIYKNISAAKIDNIEDITATTTGALAAMLDYGTVKIQTAAEKREFEFEAVPHPAKITSLLNELVLEEEKEKHEGRVS
jgi:hypothetical protein